MDEGARSRDHVYIEAANSYLLNKESWINWGGGQGGAKGFLLAPFTQLPAEMDWILDLLKSNIQKAQ